MMIKFLAWLFNWELVILKGYYGEILIRRVIKCGNLRLVKPWISVYELYEGGKTSADIYTWKTIREKK